MAQNAFGAEVAVVDRTGTDRGDPTPVGHGKDALLSAIEEEGAVAEVDHWTLADSDPVLLVGTTDDPVIERHLRADVAGPEGVVYEWAETDAGTALVAAGTDERGLLYALSELAERVADAGIEALAAVEAMAETPDNEVRGVDRFLSGPHEDDWFYSEAFWRYYLERLTRSRFNRLTLTVGYVGSFMSPPYPYFVEVPGYPDVALTDETPRDREENLEQLRQIGRLCDEYGLEFVFASWSQNPPENDLVAGLPEDQSELAAYCAAGLGELLQACPEIEGIQLRINWEAGVSVGDRKDYEGDVARDTAERFWHSLVDAVAEAVDERERDLHLDLRAKGLTDDLLQYAVETGLDVTVPTKFWCESTGLPYHNTRMRSDELAHLDDPNKARRYSYADLLREPRAYDVLYRLWTIGTNRIFVWGDPDYTRRFAQATGFGDATGFEITPPLSIKGATGVGDTWPLFDDDSLADYEFEDERYWAWYRLFGRYGYNCDADTAVWRRELRDRFGEAADAVEEGYRTASKILPILTATHLTYHPGPSYWQELDHGGTLFPDHNSNPRIQDKSYLDTEPSDPELFYGVREYVNDRLAGEITAKYTPPQVRHWFQRLAAETRNYADHAEAATDEEPTGELAATLLDFRLLADLATFHARQISAAVELATYQETGDIEHLEGAYQHVLGSLQAWETLAERGAGAYHEDLSFRTTDRGQWADYIDDLEADRDELAKQLKEAGIDPDSTVSTTSDSISRPATGLPSITVNVPDTVAPNEEISVTGQVGGMSGLDNLQLHYRRANQREGAFKSTEMTTDGDTFHGVVPRAYVTKEFDMLIYLTATDDAGKNVVVPGIYHADEPFPYYVIETTSAV